MADQAEAEGRRLSIALAAPTGKAATRLQEAVEAGLAEIARTRPRPGRRQTGSAGPPRLTLHRLLGWRPDNATRFRHDRGNRLSTTWSWSTSRRWSS